MLNNWNFLFPVYNGKLPMADLMLLIIGAKY